MVEAGITRKHLPSNTEVLTAVSQPDAEAIAEQRGTTRTAAGFDALADRLDGSINVIGNAPTALFRVLELAKGTTIRPALILGFPVGFVGAAESKEALAEIGLGIPSATLKGPRGGSAIAAAALNALAIARDDHA